VILMVIAILTMTSISTLFIDKAIAINLPYESAPLDHRFEDKQYGYTKVTIGLDNVLTIWTKFSNGKEIDGDHFGVHVILSAGDGKIIRVVTHAAGVNAAAFCRHACEWEKTTRVQLTDEERIKFASIGADYYMWDEVDDAEMSNALLKLVAALIEDYGKDETSQQNF